MPTHNPGVHVVLRSDSRAAMRGFRSARRSLLWARAQIFIARYWEPAFWILGACFLFFCAGLVVGALSIPVN